MSKKATLHLIEPATARGLGNLRSRTTGSDGPQFIGSRPRSFFVLRFKSSDCRTKCTSSRSKPQIRIPLSIIQRRRRRAHLHLHLHFHTHTHTQTRTHTHTHTQARDKQKATKNNRALLILQPESFSRYTVMRTRRQARVLSGSVVDAKRTVELELSFWVQRCRRRFNMACDACSRFRAV